jgi:hypothetical protein
MQQSCQVSSSEAEEGGACVVEQGHKSEDKINGQNPKSTFYLTQRTGSFSLFYVHVRSSLRDKDWNIMILNIPDQSLCEVSSARVQFETTELRRRW